MLGRILIIRNVESEEVRSGKVRSGGHRKKGSGQVKCLESGV